MTCPDCHGSGTGVATHVRYADGRSGYVTPQRCSRCAGSGQVDDRMADWLRRGRAMRDRRVQGTPYRTQRDEARRLGVDVVTLSRMERGLIEPMD